MTATNPFFFIFVNFELIIYRELFISDPGGVRTLDPQIKSLLLYQLSY